MKNYSEKIEPSNVHDSNSRLFDVRRFCRGDALYRSIARYSGSAKILC